MNNFAGFPPTSREIRWVVVASGLHYRNGNRCYFDINAARGWEAVQAYGVEDFNPQALVVRNWYRI
jgi:hypothetical protein